jgi:hypothetical protein
MSDRYVKLTDFAAKKENNVPNKLFPFTDKRYRQLADEGIVPEVSGGKIDLLKSIKAIFNYQEKRIKGFGSATLTDEKTEGQSLKNELLRIKVDTEKGRLIPKSDVLEEFLRRIYVLKSDLLSIEKRLPANSKEKETVKKSVRQILNNYSKGTGVLRGKK